MVSSFSKFFVINDITFCNFSINYFGGRYACCLPQDPIQFQQAVFERAKSHANLFCAFLHLFLMFNSFRFFKTWFKQPAFYFLWVSNLVLLFIFWKVYYGEAHHYGFIYIYFVASIWIYLSKNEIKTKFQKLYMIIFTMLFFGLMFVPHYMKGKDEGKHLELKKYIMRDLDMFYDHKIIIFPTGSYIRHILPYFHNKDLKFYDSDGNLIGSYNSYANLWAKLDEQANLYEIRNILDENEKAFIIFDLFNKYLFELNAKNAGLRYKFIDCVYPAYIYVIYK